MKKPKSLETKLRSAIRLIWSRSSERRMILKAAEREQVGMKGFDCPVCQTFWPMPMAEVDHEPPIGTLENWRDTVKFIEKMFFGPQRAICKLCHKQKTAQQRKRTK